MKKLKLFFYPWVIMILWMGFFACASSERDSSTAEPIQDSSSSAVPAQDTSSSVNTYPEEAAATAAPPPEADTILPNEGVGPDLNPAHYKSDPSEQELETNTNNSVVTNLEKIELKSATLGYSYPPKLKKGELGDVNVKVEIKNPNSRLKQDLTEVVISQKYDQRSNEDSIVIFSQAIPFYKEISISLFDDAKDFEISSKHVNDTQTIDTISGNNWHWTIIPKTDKKTTQLILKVVATDMNGNQKVFEPKRIFIAIKIDNNTAFRRLVSYLWDNPAVSVPILLSFFGFIGFFIKRRMAKQNPPEA